MLEIIPLAQLTYGQRLSLILLDKGVLTLVLAIAVFGFNWVLQRQRHRHEEFLQKQRSEDEKVLQDRKSRDELLNAIAESRVTAYKKLWAICKEVRFAKGAKIPDEDRKRFDQLIYDWYYKDGGAMFLSWDASHQLMKARNRLRIKEHKKAEKETDDIKKAFSTLRTELKYDCGFISSGEKTDPIGDLRELPPWWPVDDDDKTSVDDNERTLFKRLFDYSPIGIYTKRTSDGTA